MRRRDPDERWRRRQRWLWALLASGVGHAMALPAFVSTRGCGFAVASDPGVGESGEAGSGGTLSHVTEVETVVGPAVEPPAAERDSESRDENSTQAAPRTNEQTTQSDEAVVVPRVPPRRTAREEPDAGTHARSTPDASSTPDAETSDAMLATADTGTNAADAAGGGVAQTGADRTNDSGLRPGSVGHQRALLPRAMQCADPVAGIWRSHKYFPLWGDWMVATLYVHREGSERLTGRIVAHQWEGGPIDIRPPPCGPDGFEFVVEEPASGRIRGLDVDFGAITYRIRSFQCRNAHRTFDYNPDTFAGRIDPLRNEFQSRLNDGGRARDEPMVFRRIACDPAEANALNPTLVPH